MTDEILFDGKVHVSTQDAAHSVGLTRDYIARVAKAGRMRAQPTLGDGHHEQARQPRKNTNICRPLTGHAGQLEIHISRVEAN